MDNTSSEILEILWVRYYILEKVDGRHYRVQSIWEVVMMVAVV